MFSDQMRRSTIPTRTWEASVLNYAYFWWGNSTCISTKSNLALGAFTWSKLTTSDSDSMAQVRPQIEGLRQKDCGMLKWSTWPNGIPTESASKCMAKAGWHLQHWPLEWPNPQRLASSTCVGARATHGIICHILFDRYARLCKILFWPFDGCHSDPQRLSHVLSCSHMDT